MRWTEQTAQMGHTLNALILNRKPEVNQPLMRHRNKWEDNNTTINIKQTEFIWFAIYSLFRNMTSRTIKLTYFQELFDI